MSAKTKIAIMIAVIIFSIGILIYEFVTAGEFMEKHLFKGAIVILSAIISICKVITNQRASRPLSYYENFYKNELDGAFSDNRDCKKELISAIRLYNENKYEKSLDILTNLEKECRTIAEKRAVGLFKALNYSDSGNDEDAKNEYQKLIDRYLENDTIYSNLGLIYKNHDGNFEKALECFEKAITLNEQNAASWNNAASVYFSRYEFDKAIEYAKKSLDIDGTMYPASSLLAAIYTAKNDKEHADIYFHQAISTGQDRKSLERFISNYENN